MPETKLHSYSTDYRSFMPVSPDKVKSVFLAAIEHRSAEERARFLDEQCAGDAELRSRVDALLESHELLGTYHPTDAETEQHDRHSENVEQPGTQINDFRLIEKIGEGGFGIVYLAEQTQPVQRQVALKILKPGMDSREIVSRFQVEQQALARMEHPHIARVIDAGTTDTGRPYFVMEYVDGVPINEFCEQHELTLRQRLELFANVCLAVQHAHQKGVIHRDLKPGNVLVSLQDAQPAPHVIDFGIARALAPETDADGPALTRVTQGTPLLGTPLYMSPEQVDLGAVDVDTRADIYSLGVVLYELLTGTTPFDRQRLHTASFAELHRIICEEEPPPPSARVQNSGLPRDLDWITMTCLEKDRARRYASAGALAADVHRCLRHEPVLACPPSRLYRLQKFARRNRLMITAIVLVAASLITGTVASTLNAIAARNARQAAEQAEEKATGQAQRAKAVVALLLEMLDASNPDNARGTDFTVRELLDGFAANLGDELQDQPEVEATIRATIGNAYRRLGLPKDAEPHLNRALELRLQLHGSQHELVAKSRLDYAFNCWEARQPEQAETFAREALEYYRSQPEPTDQIITALRYLQLFLYARQQLDEGDAAANDALEIAAQLGIAEHSDIAIILHNLAQKKDARGDHAEAASLARRAVTMHRKVHGNDHPETAWSLTVLARALLAQVGPVEDDRSTYAEIESLYREALQIFRRQFGAGYRGAHVALRGLTETFAARGRHSAAVAEWRTALELRQERFDARHLRVGEAMLGCADSMRRTRSPHDDDKAIPLYAEAIAILREHRSEEAASINAALDSLARLLQRRRRFEELEELWRATLHRRHEQLGDGHLRTAWAASHLAGALRHRDPASAEALSLFEGTLPVFHRYRASEYSGIVQVLIAIAAVLKEQDRTDEAIERLEHAAVELTPISDDPFQFGMVARIHCHTAWLLRLTGEPERSLTHYRLAREAFEAADDAVPQTPGPRAAWYTHHAEACLRLKDPRAALPHLAAAIEVRPDWQHSYLLRSEALLSIGESQLALADARRAVELRKTWYSLQRRAQAHRACGDSAAALADFDAALKLQPDNTPLQQERSALLAEMQSKPEL